MIQGIQMLKYVVLVREALKSSNICYELTSYLKHQEANAEKKYVRKEIRWAEETNKRSP